MEIFHTTVKVHSKMLETEDIVWSRQLNSVITETSHVIELLEWHFERKNI